MAVDAVKDYGEVLTPMPIVKQMLNMIPEGISLDMRVLEPSCGTGNFLEEIINRKLPNGDKHTEEEVIRAYASIWGIDIQPRNVAICRKRLYDMHPCEAVRDILVHNIVVGNFLNEKMIKMDWDCEALIYETEEPVGYKLVVDGEDLRVEDILLLDNNIIVGDLDVRVLNIETMKFET